MTSRSQRSCFIETEDVDGQDEGAEDNDGVSMVPSEVRIVP
jgi:hypothetical protein